jgi:hypothetical protein
MDDDDILLRRKFSGVWPLLDERGRRLMAASEALSSGYGGVSRIRRACGLSRKAIAKGIQEIADGDSMPGRIRRSGAGRKSIIERDPKLLVSLDRLIEPDTRGDPESPLRWICKSTRNLAAQLTRQKHSVSHEKVAQLLRDQNYSLQSNRKTEEGANHPDRDAQFRHISAQVKRALATGTPVISVDTKKKELLGNYDNGGRQWLPAKKPIKVNGHDFPSPDVPRAYPYGIYDLGRNTGFVNVGTDHDTGAFAVASIRGWWRSEGDGCMRRREHSLSRRMVGVAMARDYDSGNWSCRSSRMRRAFRFLSVTFRLAPAVGTRLNIGCFLSSPRIGAVNRFGIMRRS